MTPTSDSNPRRRAGILVALPFLAAAALLAACGGASTATKHSPSHQPTASATDDTDDSDDSDTDTPDASPTPVANDISVGDVAFSSTLKTPTQDFGVHGDNVHEDSTGITLTVPQAGGHYTYSAPVYLNGIPQSMAVRVKIDEPQQNGLYAGLACRGLDDKNTYILAVDSKGDFAVVRVQAGNQTVLQKGDAAFEVSWPITLDIACVTPSSSSTTNRLVLVANGTKLASVDDSFDNVAISNSFALFAISPSADTGTGSVTFHDLSVRSASAE